MASVLGEGILGTLIELFVWLGMLLLAIPLATPVIFFRALRSGRACFTRLAFAYRAVFVWWWDHHPFQG